MGSNGDTATRCTVVALHFDTKSLMASDVSLKGASHEFPARRLVACFKELGLEAHDLTVNQPPAGVIALGWKKKDPCEDHLRDVSRGIFGI